MRTAKFAGVNLRQTESSLLRQKYRTTLKTLPSRLSNRGSTSSFRAKLAWLVYARPDICARVAKLAQVTEQQFRTDEKYCFRVLEDCSLYVQKYEVSGNYPALDLDSLYFRGYADASFGMSVDVSSQICYCILFLDKFDSCAIVLLRSGKCH
jgi:hypothetical protein